MASRFACLVLALVLLIHSVQGKTSPKKDGKKEKPKGGSAKCTRGVFESLAKDATIPLCDAHYPDEKTSKNDWLVLFYNKATDAKIHREPLNRVALDLGNEPPEKSKAQKLPQKKQRQRIKDLAEKWNFAAHIPKKGLEDKGKEALLKVGAVCCDCGEEQKICQENGLGLRLVRAGKDDIVDEEQGVDKLDSEKAMHFAMANLGFIKGVEASASSKTSSKPATKAASAKEAVETKEALTEKLETLKEAKKKAAADEEYTKAAELKAEITAVEEKLKTAPSAADAAAAAGPQALQQKMYELVAEKKKAVAAEDFKTASELKKQIDELAKEIADAPKAGANDAAALKEKLGNLQEAKKAAIAEENFKEAARLKKVIAELEASKTEL